MFSLNIRNKSFSLFPYSIVLEVLASSIRQGRESKGIQIGKEEVKLFSYENDMIINVVNPIESTKLL